MLASIEITGLPAEKAEKLAKLLEKLVDNADAVDDVIDTLAKIRETGILAGANAIAEGFEEGFNYLMRPELISSLGNMMMLLYLVGSLDNAMVYELASKLPPRLSKAYEEFKQKPRRKAGFFELLSLMRSPELFAMLKAVSKIASNKEE